MTRDNIPRIRMFAGPNGSGKSTIKSLLKPSLIGVYVNPDEIQQQIESTGLLDLDQFCVRCSIDELKHHFRQSSLAARAALTEIDDVIAVRNLSMMVVQSAANSYLAAIIADFIRQQLVVQRVSFTFETVMSSADKVALLASARSKGFRTYLYYIATGILQSTSGESNVASN